jgi:hypothetical protein
MQEPQTNKAVVDKFIASRSQGKKLKGGIASLYFYICVYLSLVVTIRAVCVLIYCVNVKG